MTALWVNTRSFGSVEVGAFPFSTLLLMDEEVRAETEQETLRPGMNKKQRVILKKACHKAGDGRAGFCAVGYHGKHDVKRTTQH